jgi:hypothetical protein
MSAQRPRLLGLIVRPAEHASREEEVVAEAKRLRTGIDSPSPTPAEEKERIEVLRATVRKYLPDFARGVAAVAAKGEKDSTMVLHQDAFAAGYDDDEYILLGMAVKYAGLHGVNVTVIGKNHETF